MSLRALAAAAALAILAVAPATAQTAFYQATEAELAGAPGTIIRQEPIASAPQGAIAIRVLYRSTGLSGEPIAVSGVVFVPTGGTPAVGSAPHVVAWAHPTTGVATHCAPSLAPLMQSLLPGLEDMIRQGYVVAATDYPGLGTAGVHPYLIGESEGRAVLDSVRAARTVAESHIGPVDSHFALWGHSQGGHAAIFASQLAPSYAPELQLVGLAVAAPATELATLLRDDAATDGGKNLTGLTLWAWSQLFGDPLDAVVRPAAIANLDALAADCLDTIVDLVERRGPARTLDAGFLSVPDLTAVEPWGGYMTANTPGPTPRGLPVFIAQGEADQLVLPRVTETYIGRLCADGRDVTILMMPGVNHGDAGFRSAPTAIPWLTDRFNGVAAANHCPG